VKNLSTEAAIKRRNAGWSLNISPGSDSDLFEKKKMVRHD